MPLAILVSVLSEAWIEQRMQQLIELGRGHAQHGFFLVDQTFLYHLDRDAQRRRAGSLAVARLQHEQLAVLDGELEILHVAIVLFEAAGDVAKLAVSVGHHFFQIRNGQGRANAGHHVFALRIQQELAPENLFARGRIAREADARAGSLAQIAEHHGLDIGGRADVVGNLFHAPIGDRVLAPPGAEHSVARHGELLARVLRKRLSRSPSSPASGSRR